MNTADTKPLSEQRVKERKAITFWDLLENPKPSQAYLGRDAKGVGNPCVLIGFRAFNVALTDEEVAEIDPLPRN